MSIAIHLPADAGIAKVLHDAPTEFPHRLESGTLQLRAHHFGRRGRCRRSANAARLLVGGTQYRLK